AYAGFALGLAHINDLHVHDALDSWQTALIHARRADDFIREAWALHRIPLALTLLGRLAEADAVAVRACESTRRSHDWSNHSLGLSPPAPAEISRSWSDARTRPCRWCRARTTPGAPSARCSPWRRRARFAAPGA